MKPKRIKYSSTFFKSLKKLPKSQLKFLKIQEQLFRENIFHPKLKTHKLKGELSGFYSFSVSYHWRVVFHVETGQTIVLDNIGTHEIYR